MVSGVAVEEARREGGTVQDTIRGGCGGAKSERLGGGWEDLCRTWEAVTKSASKMEVGRRLSLGTEIAMSQGAVTGHTLVTTHPYKRRAAPPAASTAIASREQEQEQEQGLHCSRRPPDRATARSTPAPPQAERVGHAWRGPAPRSDPPPIFCPFTRPGPPPSRDRPHARPPSVPRVHCTSCHACV